MNRSNAVELIRSLVPAETQDGLIAQLHDSVRVSPNRVSLDQLPLGASRFGGMPDLPAGFSWPEWQAYKSHFEKGKVVHSPPFPAFLHFLAQINLRELSRLEACRSLPKTGGLCFFHDMVNEQWGFTPRDRGSACVVYFDMPENELVRTSSPVENSYPIEPCALAFAEEVTLPDDLFFGIYEVDTEIGEQLREAFGLSKICHRLLGDSQSIQGDMRLECQLVANGIDCGRPAGYNDPRREQLERRANDWRLLLQLDSDEANPGWMWGDVGRIYYWIRDQDLSARDFSQCWRILQCH